MSEFGLPLIELNQNVNTSNKEVGTATYIAFNRTKLECKLNVVGFYNSKYIIPLIELNQNVNSNK